MKKILTMFFFLSNFVLADNNFINNYVFDWGDYNPKVIEVYLKSNLSNPNSAYILGTLYLTGTFLKKDLKRADLYITMAANSNMPEAINSIGDGYYSGDIRPRNQKLALRYYRKAADLGFGPAQFNAGIVLMNRAKSKADLNLAILYLDKASKNIKDLGEDMTKFAKRYKDNVEKLLKHYR